MFDTSLISVQFLYASVVVLEMIDRDYNTTSKIWVKISLPLGNRLVIQRNVINYDAITKILGKQAIQQRCSLAAWRSDLVDTP